MLSRFAQSVSDGLKNAELPPPRLDGLNFDTAKVVAEIEPLRAGAGRSLGARGDGTTRSARYACKP